MKLRSWAGLTAAVILLIACAVIGLRVPSNSENTAPPPTPVPMGGRTWEGADIVFRWVNFAPTDDKSTCFKDSEGALTDAFKAYDPKNPTLKTPNYAAFKKAMFSYTGARQPGLVFYMTKGAGGKSKSRQRFDEHHFDDHANNVRTLTYSTTAEGSDESFDVFLIERDEDSYKTSGGDTMVLVGVFGLIYGVSQCGATEGALEDKAFFHESWIWFSGYYAHLLTQAGAYEYPSNNLRDFAEKYRAKGTPLDYDGAQHSVCCELHLTAQPPPVTPESPKPPTEKPKAGNPESPKPPTENVPPVDKDKNFKPVQPEPGSGTGIDNGVYVPPIAGPGSYIVGSVENPNTNTPSGPTSFIVGAVLPDGKKTFWSGLTDEHGHFKLGVPVGVLSLFGFLLFDQKGHPDQGPVCTIGRPPHLDGTTPLTDVPGAQQPAILEGSPSYQRGNAGLFNLHTRGNDPLTTRVLLDGKPDGVQTLAASDESLSARFANDVPLGRHRMSIESSGKRSNEFSAVLVSIVGEPLMPVKTGQVSMVRVHVEGLPPNQSASMVFHVGGASTLATGGSTMTVPVKDGIAQVQIRAVHPGQTQIQFTLLMSLPGFAPQG
jgi:hypothetical protein